MTLLLFFLADYTPGSAQYNWLLKDIASVDRVKTPWLIVNMHTPWYHTYV